MEYNVGNGFIQKRLPELSVSAEEEPQEREEPLELNVSAEEKPQER